VRRSKGDECASDHFLHLLADRSVHLDLRTRLWCLLGMRSDRYLHKTVISSPTGNIQGAVLGLVLGCAVNGLRLVRAGGNGAGVGG